MIIGKLQSVLLLMRKAEGHANPVFSVKRSVLVLFPQMVTCLMGGWEEVEHVFPADSIVLCCNIASLALDAVEQRLSPSSSRRPASCLHRQAKKGRYRSEPSVGVL